MGARGHDAFPPAREKLEAAYRQAGRQAAPRAMAMTYVSLDDAPEAQARRTIGDYYAHAPDYADHIVDFTAKGEDEVKERVRGFEEAGCDELILFAASANPEQVDKLAAAVL